MKRIATGLKFTFYDYTLPAQISIASCSDPLILFSLDEEHVDSDTQPPPLATESRKPRGSLPYVISGASFIPLIGVVFGLIAIVWGIARRIWQLMVLGACGILFTIVIYSALFYFGLFHRGGIFDELRSQLAVTMLNDCVKEVEFYKLTHGHYPASLSELDSRDKAQLPKCFDPTIIDFNPKRDRHFFYQLDPSGSFYFLFSVGPDGVPFTADDIFPTIRADERAKTGLRLGKESSNQTLQPTASPHE
jgi:hypothetical protein